MKAMILGAGHGTRLRPLYQELPKLLVPVLGVPMLERLLAALMRGGVDEIALNTHHLANRVRHHMAGMPASLPRPLLFHEPELLGTGGAVVNAAPFWEGETLLVWNGDIMSGVELSALQAAHRRAGALATLVVQERPGDSLLLADGAGRLCGIDSRRRGVTRRILEPEGGERRLAFDGISVLEPALREHLPEDGAFDLIEVLLRALEAGAPVAVHDAGAAPYGTTGTPAQLRELEALLSGDPALLARWTPPEA